MTKHFKVLVNGQSCHGGNLAWSLPQRGDDGAWTPGQWHEVDGTLSPCHLGLHVTAVPAEWWVESCMVYVVEIDGDERIEAGNKTVCRKVRLLAEATEAELAEAQIFFTGKHTIKAGKAIAWENSSVEAWGNSSVEAWGNSSVEAWENSSVVARGNSSVVAWENSSVEAWGNSSVEAWGNSSVEARGNSSVVARGNSSVVAWENSSVVAWGNSSVVAWGNSSVEAWGNSSVVARGNSTTNILSGSLEKRVPHEYAILIDRTRTPPQIIASWEVKQGTLPASVVVEAK